MFATTHKVGPELVADLTGAHLYNTWKQWARKEEVIRYVIILLSFHQEGTK